MHLQSDAEGSRIFAALHRLQKRCLAHVSVLVGHLRHLHVQRAGRPERIVTDRHPMGICGCE